MSNLNEEIDYGDLTTVLKFAFEQMLKGVYTAMPGVVESYNSTTKRARVVPAINVKRTDGTTTARPAIANVPVVHPSGGGFVVLLPIKAGDTVLCVFSQRGLTKFKEAFGTADPDESLLDIKDAIIIPGFGGLEVTPSTTDGVSMQNETGTNYINVTDGAINITSTGPVNVSAPTVEVEADINVTGDITVTGKVTSNGIELDTHTHSGVQSGGSNTGGPN